MIRFFENICIGKGTIFYLVCKRHGTNLREKAQGVLSLREIVLVVR